MAGLGYTLVDFDELDKAIAQLKNTKDNLGNQLKKIKGIVDGSVNSPEIYLSMDARVTQEKFEEMFNKWAIKFDNYVQEYIDYFEKTKTMYAERGDDEAKKASQLNSFID